MKPLNDVMTEQ